MSSPAAVPTFWACVSRMVARLAYGSRAARAARSPLACWLAYFREAPVLGAKTRLRVVRPICLLSSQLHSGRWGVEYAATFDRPHGLVAEVVVPKVWGVRYFAPDLLVSLLHEGGHLDLASGNHGRVWRAVCAELVERMFSHSMVRRGDPDSGMRHAVLAGLDAGAVREPRVTFRRVHPRGRSTT